MKAPLEAPPEQVKAETGVKETPKTGAPPVIDTSKMSAGKAAALELAEASRDPLDERGSFASNLFIGKFGFERIFPYPAQSEEDRAKGEAFLTELKNYLRDHVDADEIDRTGEIPQKNIEELFAMGAFGVKIPQQYEGLGLSQVNYGRAAMLLGSWDANLTALVSAHQSIGVPQPLLLFGTEEQKKKYLPRVARREISAFALTEWNAGSDPANMSLRADPTEDGAAFILNGEKLWCTNLIKAGVLVVMARTPPKIVKGKERKQITAFIVDVDSPGLEITYRCHFMGLRALYNGVVKFTRSEEHTSELQSRFDLVCRLLLEKKKKKISNTHSIKKQHHNGPYELPYIYKQSQAQGTQLIVHIHTAVVPTDESYTASS